MGRPRKYDREIIMELHSSGKTADEIANALNAPIKTIYKVLSFNDARPNKPAHVIENKRRQEEKKQQRKAAEMNKKIRFAEVISAGGSYAEAGAAVGLSHRSAVHYGTRNGIRSSNKGAAAFLDDSKVQYYCSLCGFTYSGGYSGESSRIKVVCNYCGQEYEYSIISIRHRSVSCKKCHDAEKSLDRYVRSLIMAEEKQAVREKHEAIRIMNKYALIEHKKKKRMYQHIFPKWEVETHTCRNCGKTYIPEETGYRSQKYCSAVCQRRFYDRQQDQKRDHRKRWRKHDVDISLDALYQRDHGICYLCGSVCDYSDMKIIDGTFVAGNMYPSIDHVIPLSRGGTDTWDNIKLAHRLCNSKKGAAYDPDETRRDA